MKIKTYKYFLIYFAIICLWIYLFNNIDGFSLYLKNYKNIEKLENIKSKKYIKLWEKLEKEIENIKNIDTTDIINLYTIKMDLEKAEQIINSKNKYTWEDFYNLWNIYFLKWYKIFKENKSWAIEDIQNAISNYDLALETIPSYKKKKFIVNNLNLAKQYLTILYVYECNKFFINLISTNNKIINKLTNLISIFQKQIKNIQKWKKYPEFEKCMKSFEKDAFKNIEIIWTNINFFQKTKKWIINIYQYYQDNEDVCYLNKKYMENKYKESLDSSLKYFSKFEDKQSKILYLFEKWTKKYIKQLCDGKWKLSKQQSKENQKMSKNFNNLNELLNN